MYQVYLNFMYLTAIYHGCYSPPGNAILPSNWRVVSVPPPLPHKNYHITIQLVCCQSAPHPPPKNCHITIQRGCCLNAPPGILILLSNECVVSTWCALWPPCRQCYHLHESSIYHLRASLASPSGTKLDALVGPGGTKCLQAMTQMVPKP